MYQYARQHRSRYPYGRQTTGLNGDKTEKDERWPLGQENWDRFHVSSSS